MAKVIPFKGILYNHDKISGDAVTAPPYDIISPEFREQLYQKSPYNVVRIDFGKEMPDDSGDNNKYSRANGFFKKWLEEGILIRDSEPAFYAYEIDYTVSGQKKTLRGILALIKIEELGNGIYPHEATHSKPKADRLNLMRACLANTSPIYSLYNSPDKVTSNILNNIRENPYITAKDSDGAVHKLYRIADSSSINAIAKELSDKPVFIADGHHRYEVALEFKKEMDNSKLRTPNSEPKPWDYVMMFLANMADEGITILPTHRMVKDISRKEDVVGKLKSDFDIYELQMDSDIIRTISKEGKNTLGLYLHFEKEWHILKYKGHKLEDIHPALNSLDVVLLHELILKRDLGITDVAYEMNANEAIRRVHDGDFDAVFFLNPTGVDDVEKAALAGLRMPPKSTYFYPKLLTGMVINKFMG
jgi:uncharacterized protein (DUF1015 family)